MASKTTESAAKSNTDKKGKPSKKDSSTASTGSGTNPTKENKAKAKTSSKSETIGYWDMQFSNDITTLGQGLDAKLFGGKKKTGDTAEKK